MVCRNGWDGRVRWHLVDVMQKVRCDAMPAGMQCNQ